MTDSYEARPTRFLVTRSRSPEKTPETPLGLVLSQVASVLQANL